MVEPSNTSVKRYPKFTKQTRCRFCRENIQIDYKDITLLTKLCTPQMRITSRKKNGNCHKHQKLTEKAIKYARLLALIPFEGQR